MQIESKEALEQALASERFLLFKHSHVCSVSARAFAEYEAFLAEHADVESGWLDVRGQRDLSLWVAEHTGVPHESPQAILMRNGEAVWNASHFDITRESLGRAV